MGETWACNLIAFSSELSTRVLGTWDLPERVTKGTT